MVDELKQTYICLNCHEYLDLANIPNVAFDFQTQNYIWTCPCGYENNSKVGYKY